MTTMQINIIHPKALRLLKDLADLDLIQIEKKPKSDLTSLLKKLTAKSKEIPTLEEITKEVELVRNKRYAQKNKGNN
jgi:hypothetical protein